MKKIFLAIICAALFFSNTFSQVITVSALSTGFTRPVCIQNSGMPNDDRLFVIEKAGRIRIIDRVTGTVTVTPFLNITSRVGSSGNEQGLLGLAFHPDYANNGYFYVDYTNLSGRTIIARYQVSSFPDTAMVNSEQIMMTIYQPAQNHNGGNLMFGFDGYLYISMGDGGGSGDQGTGHNATYGNAQHIDSLLGKILRVDVNNPNPPYYYSPSTNPFYGSNAPSSIPYAGTLPGRDEIFDWGVRNPWRASIDRLTGDKWIGDVGQNAREEIDFSGRCDSLGKNYGWRCYEGIVAYNTANCQAQSSYTGPVFDYGHSGGNCSVTGGYVYRGGLEGGMFGKYFFTDYCTGIIWSTSPNGSGGWTTTQRPQTNALMTFEYTSFGEDIYGEVYIAGETGAIYTLRDTACAPVAYIYSRDTIVRCTSPVSVSAIYGQNLTYTWSVTGTGWSISSGQGTNSVSLLPGTAIGTVSVSVSNGTCNASSNSIRIYTDATFTGLDTMYCSNASSVTLMATPAGGIFSGAGVTGNSFNPNTAGAGIHPVVYTYTDNISSCYFAASGCILTDTQYVHVVAAPTVSITGADTLYCVNDPVVTFTGNPPGGTFSGRGMTGNSFNPSAAGIGYDTITYAYTDVSTGCSNSISTVIHVDACLGIGGNSSLLSLSLFPNPNNGEFTLNLIMRKEQQLNAEITDVLGKVIFEKQISVTTGNNSVQLNNILAKGVYLLMLRNENINALRSFIVK
jgi:glucose/arabinose dehydrogenase